MSALAMMYEPCLWWPLYATNIPISCRRAAHDSGRAAVSRSIPSAPSAWLSSSSAARSTRRACSTSTWNRSEKARMVRSRTSSCWMRPSRSYSTPSRSAPLDGSISARAMLSNTAIRMARPPGKTGARSSGSPRMRVSASMLPASSAALRRRFSPFGVIAPLSDQPFSRRMSAMAWIVPDEPMAELQPMPR